MISNILVIIVIAIIFPATLVHAGEPFFGTVKKVIDGDSLLITANGRNIEIRLYGIDAPEHNQPFGEEAKIFIRKWVGWQRIKVQPEYADSYGRTVAVIVKGDQVLNSDLVQAGMAWVYPRYCRKEVCKTWTEMEDVARKQKKGLWFDLKQMAPWKWKRQGDGR